MELQDLWDADTIKIYQFDPKHFDIKKFWDYEQILHECDFEHFPHEVNYFLGYVLNIYIFFLNFRF